MPTSDRAGTALGILACLALAGCLQAGPVPVMRVAGDEVTIVGPKGYCVDRRTALERRAGSFVVLGDCGVLSGGAPEANPAVLTALVSAATEIPQRPTAAQLESYFRSDAGRAALSHDGTASTVTLLEARQDGDVVYLKVRDRSAGRPETLADTSWRAVFSLNDRLVSLSVASHADVPVGDLSMRRKLEAFVAAVQGANGAGGAEDA